MKKNKTKIYGIIGLGRFGTALAFKLASMGAEILAVDKDESKVNDIKEVTEDAFITNNLDKKTLIDMGFQNCDIVVVCIGGLIDVSILTVMKLQSMGIKRIIAKATSQEHGDILRKLGAEVVYPEQDMAIRLANRIEIGQGLDFIELSDSINVSKVSVPSAFVGKTVQESAIRLRFGLNIIAIESNDVVLDRIAPDYVFTKDDVLYLCGNKAKIVEFNEWLEK